MVQTYEIKHADVPVGTARAEKQGLYLSFSCRCCLPKEGLYRIHVICGGTREDLGICVPLDGTFGMDKRIPAKRLGEGELTFELVSKDWTPPVVTVTESEVPMEEEISIPEPVEENLPPVQQFVPVSEEEPFEHLDKLEEAHMEIRDDQPGIVIEHEAEA